MAIEKKLTVGTHVAAVVCGLWLTCAGHDAAGMFILCMAAFFLIVIRVDDRSAVDVGAWVPDGSPLHSGRADAARIAGVLGRRGQVMAEILRAANACRRSGGAHAPDTDWQRFVDRSTSIMQDLGNDDPAVDVALHALRDEVLRR